MVRVEEEEAEVLEAEVEEAAVGSGHGGSTVTMVPSDFCNRSTQ